MTQVTLPKLNQSGANEWADVQDNDEALKAVINGGLDNSNLTGSAGITDANLASPNNSAYKLIAESNSLSQKEMVAGTYFGLVNAGALVVSGFGSIISLAAQPAG